MRQSLRGREWLDSRVSPFFWTSIENQKRFLSWLAKKHRVRHPSDWYRVPAKHFPQALIEQYGCHQDLLKAHFPNHDWHEWLFQKVPTNFWRDPANRRRYLRWLGKRLGYRKPTDWYAVTGDNFRRNSGGALLASYYAGSYQMAVRDLFENYEWNEWQFARTPDGFWECQINRRRYLDWLGVRLGFESAEDWHGLTWQILSEYNGSGLIDHVGSVIEIVRERYPKDEIREWLFASSPAGFWDKQKNRHRYMDWLGLQLGFRKIEDWYQLTADAFRINSGSGLLQLKFHNSVVSALKDRFPQVEWHEWLLDKVPQRFWKDMRNCRRYCDWLATRLRFTRQEDWYKIGVDDFKNNQGWGILQQFRSSPSETIISVYSEKKWDAFAFSFKPQGFWRKKSNRRLFFENLFAKKKLKVPKDVYELSWEDVVENGGAGLLREADNSFTKAIISCFPEHDWIEWKFTKVSPGFWDDDQNVTRYLKWLGEQLGFTTAIDWYAITTKAFSENFGNSVLSLRFNGSPIAAVKHLHQKREWHEWKFAVCPNGFWRQAHNRKRYLMWLGGELGIKTYEDWYHVSSDKLNKHYGAGLLDFCGGSQVSAIIEAFPEHEWDVEKFSYMRMNQKRIFRIIKQRYRDAVWQYKHPDLRFSDSGRKMELDIWIPSIRTAVEYQGQQHFFEVKSWGGKKALRKVQKRDSDKRKACARYGIRLIEIPYTWDGCENSVLRSFER
jgi:hypothetical protein